MRAGLIGLLSLAGGLAGHAVSAQPAAEAPRPLIAGAHFHHLAVNSADPARTIAFYGRHFAAEPRAYAGREPAVWTQKSWILVKKTHRPPPAPHTTAIWHVGWGAPDPKAEYARQKALGAEFIEPITDISTMLGGAPDRFYYMYVASPDRQQIELNTAKTNAFGHIHMFSADPIAAGDWWIRVFGLTGRPLSTSTQPSRAPRFATNGVQVGPSSSLYFDNVNLIIFPVEYSRKAYADEWTKISALQSTRGAVNDHIGISVPDLDAALAALRAEGVKVTGQTKAARGRPRSAFIEGPDKVAIELIEGPAAG